MSAVRFPSRTLATVVVMLTTGATAAYAQDRRVETNEAIRVAIAQATREAVRENTRVTTHVVTSLVNDLVRDVRSAADVETRAWSNDIQGQDRRVEQIDRETKTLALGPNGWLDLQNINGDVSVTAGTGRDVTIEIVRRSRAATDADAKLGLDRVKVTVDQKGERADVRAVYPQERRPPFSVNIGYTVTAPAGTRVSTTSISGNVTIKGMRGDQSVNVTSGDVSISGGGSVSQARTISGNVTLSDIAAEGTVQAGTVSGDVVLQRVKASRLEVSVTSGDVHARDVTCSNAELKGLSGDVEFTGPLAKGGRYELQAHSGSIHVVVTGNAGFDLQATTFSGDIKPDAGLALKAVSSSRRSLRGTFGEGGATLIATTFSGDVVIGRK